MQRGGKDFLRASNEESLGVLGDPERWGARGEVSVLVPTGNASDQTNFSEQIVRAQCAELIARAWEVSCIWAVDGRDAGDTMTLSLHVTWGVGQANAQGYIVLPTVVVAPAGAFPWQTNPIEGTLQLPRPLPAAAISIRGRLRIVAAGGAAAHTVLATLGVFIAPRALV